MSTHNIGFYEDLTKLSLNYHQISSNTHLISSAVLYFDRVTNNWLSYISAFISLMTKTILGCTKK